MGNSYWEVGNGQNWKCYISSGNFPTLNEKTGLFRRSKQFLFSALADHVSVVFSEKRLSALLQLVNKNIDVRGISRRSLPQRFILFSVLMYISADTTLRLCWNTIQDADRWSELVKKETSKDPQWVVAESNFFIFWRARLDTIKIEANDERLEEHSKVSVNTCFAKHLHCCSAPMKPFSFNTHFHLPSRKKYIPTTHENNSVELSFVQLYNVMHYQEPHVYPTVFSLDFIQPHW